MATSLSPVVLLFCVILSGCTTPSIPDTPPVPPPVPPSGHTALFRKIGHDSPTVSWDTYTGAASGLVLTWSPGASVTLPVTSTSYQVTGLRSGVDYLFSLCAVLSNSDSCISTNWVAP